MVSIRVLSINTFLLTIASVLCLIAIRGTVSGAGVTIITHGFGSGTDTWIDDMAQAIIDRDEIEDIAVYTVIVEGDPLISPDLQIRRGEELRIGPQPKDADACEVVLLVCWSDIDSFDESTCTGRVASEIADLVTGLGLLSSDELDTRLAELPFHLIGHSRGGSLVSELSEQLGRSGLWVDQLTMLDPRPVPIGGGEKECGGHQGDAPVVVYENVVFADNYFRDGCGTPDGRSVQFAHEIHLSGLFEHHCDCDSLLPCFVPHELVHTFYHGTIDSRFLGEVDGQSIQSEWYQRDDTSPRDRIGFHWSRISGGSRPVDGVHSAFLPEGGVNREPILHHVGRQWPNIGEISAGTNQVVIGEPTTISFFYQDDDSSPTAELYLDADRNPYTDNATLIWNNSDRPLFETEGPYPWDLTWIPDPSAVSAGEYFLYGKITDGDHTRYAYAPETLVVVEEPDPDRAPALSNDRVNPSRGSTGTQFSFRVRYLDEDGDDPTAAFVFVDGIRYSLRLETGTGSNGTYVYQTTLNQGVYTYFFQFHDARGRRYQTPSRNGPVVGQPGTIPLQFYYGGGGGVPVNDWFEIRYSINGGQTYEISGSSLVGSGFTALIDLPASLRLSAHPGGNHEFREWQVYCCEGGVDRLMYEGPITPQETLDVNPCEEVTVYTYWGYTPEPHSISGTVMGPAGPIQGAIVTLEGSSVVTGADGAYSFSDVGGGREYTVTAEHSDYSFVPPVFVVSCLDDSEVFNFNAVSSDITAPALELVGVPDEYTDEDTSVTFEWSGQDNSTAPEELEYQFGIGTSASSADWVRETSVTYDLPNGVYTFNLRARDEFGNGSEIQSYTFAVSAAPSVQPVADGVDALWFVEVEIRAPEEGTGPFDKVVLVPERLGLIGSGFVPVRLYPDEESDPIGTIEYASEELGLPAVFEEAEIGFLMTLPTPLLVGETVRFLIQWGKLVHLGWEDKVQLREVPGIGVSDNNISRYAGALVDSNRRFWRLWTRTLYLIPGTEPGGGATTGQSSLYMQVTDSEGRILVERILESRAPDFSTESGWQFVGADPGFVETPTEVWAFWRLQEVILREANKWAFGLQRFSKNTLQPLEDPVCSSFAERAVAAPKRASTGEVWLRGTQSNPPARLFSQVSAAGDIVAHLVPLLTPPSGLTKPAVGDSAGILSGVDGRMWFFHAWRWEASSSNRRERGRHFSAILNPDRSVFAEDSFGPAPLSSALEADDIRFLEGGAVVGADGKAWVSYGQNVAGVRTDYYTIFSENGEVIKDVERRRRFHFADRDGYIWATENDVLYLVDSEDTVAMPFSVEAFIPNQEVGAIAANVQPESFQIFDRWSARTLQVSIGRNEGFGPMEVIDIDKFGQGAHVDNLQVAKAGSIVAEIPGEIPLQSEIEVVDFLGEGINVLSFSQDGLIGGELLVTFEFPSGALFVRSDVNGDGFIDIGDAIYLLIYRFLEGPSPPCEDAADFNDDTEINVTDAVGIINFSLLGGVAPALPYPDCARDATEDALTCEQVTAGCD